LIEGAVPGAKSGWVTVRDAVKKKLPKEAPKPGKFRVSETAEANPDQKPGKTELEQPKAAPEQAPNAEQAAAQASAAADQAAKAATQAAKGADQVAKAADEAAVAAKKKKEGE
jgi:hypothetical protein